MLRWLWENVLMLVGVAMLVVVIVGMSLLVWNWTLPDPTSEDCDARFREQGVSVSASCADHVEGQRVTPGWDVCTCRTRDGNSLQLHVRHRE